MHIHIYICTSVYVCILYISIYMHVCIYIYMCIRKYMYVHKCIPGLPPGRQVGKHGLHELGRAGACGRDRLRDEAVLRVA